MSFRERQKSPCSMEGFFYPQSLAVIGVSPKKSNLARNVIKNCMEFGFKGKNLRDRHEIRAGLWRSNLGIY